MPPQLRPTVCDHTAGIDRIRTTRAAELLTAAAQHDLPQRDEKRSQDVFAPPELPTQRGAAAR